MSILYSRQEIKIFVSVLVFSVLLTSVVTGMLFDYFRHYPWTKTVLNEKHYATNDVNKIQKKKKKMKYLSCCFLAVRQPRHRHVVFYIFKEKTTYFTRIPNVC